nr:cupin-like domain-containing protein [Rheinheimera maricola]
MPSPAEVSGVTAENFAAKITDIYRPAVLRGFANHWPVVQAAKQSDSAAARLLQQHSKDTPQALLQLPASINGRLFYNDTLTGMNFSGRQTRMNAAIEQMLQGRHDSERYCIQCVSVAANFSDLSLDNPLLPADTKAFVWLGNSVTVPAHFDEASNIAVVVAGKRRFTLFPPEQVANLYIGPLDLTPAGQPVSMVNMLAPDLIAHPNYPKAYAVALSVELEPGDAIYIPTPWWHHVQSLSAFNALVNYWWSDTYVAGALPFPMLLHGLLSLKHMPVAQQQAWQQLLRHYLLAENGDPAAHLPQHAKGILGEMTPQLAHGIHQWLANQLK